MKKRTLFLSTATALVMLSSCGKTQGTLTLENDTVEAGQEIVVEFTAPANLESNAWVGIIPSEIEHGSEAVNDQHDVAYEYISGATSGSMTFTAPNQGGSWDFRMHTTDSDGDEIATVTFTVTARASLEAGLTLSATSFSEGDEIEVTFTAPNSVSSDAWVGLIPSNIAHGEESVNDQHDVDYKYLSGKNEGTLTFEAPEAGSWDLRMHDTDANGAEIASVSFQVQ